MFQFAQRSAFLESSVAKFRSATQVVEARDVARAVVTPAAWLQLVSLPEDATRLEPVWHLQPRSVTSPNPPRCFSSPKGESVLGLPFSVSYPGDLPQSGAALTGLSKVAGTVSACP